jgi:hypothetical protein
VRFVTGHQDIFGPDSHVDTPGYVLVPGCQLTDIGFYSILDYRPIALAPEWLAAYIVDKEHSTVEQTPAVELDTPDLIAWAVDHLTRDAKPCIEGNGGERTMLLLAGVLKDHGISEQCAVELITEHFNERCEPPWNGGDGELADRLDVKIANAYRYLRQTQPGRATAQVDFAGAVDENETDLEAIEAARVATPAWRAWRRRQDFVQIDGSWTRRTKGRRS